MGRRPVTTRLMVDAYRVLQETVGVFEHYEVHGAEFSHQVLQFLLVHPALRRQD